MEMMKVTSDATTFDGIKVNVTHYVPDGYRKHDECDHEATPAARKKCRAERSRITVFTTTLGFGKTETFIAYREETELFRVTHETRSNTKVLLGFSPTIDFAMRMIANESWRLHER
jgi:hypothetical protein